MMQLPLGFTQEKPFTFDDFYTNRNQEIVETMKAISQSPEGDMLYCWGGSGSGKSHLLQALSVALSENQHSVFYLPLSQKHKFTPELLEGLEHLQVICIDDIQHIAGDQKWEEAIFHLYNQLRETGHRMVMAGNAPPPLIKFQLNDLASRMNWGLIYQLQDLNDSEKLQVLKKKANANGFELPEEVGEYLIKRLPRNMHDLCDFLDQLDAASLAAQRKLTIPFVRELIQNSGAPTSVLVTQGN